MNLKKSKTIVYPFTQKTPFGAVNIYQQRGGGRTRYFVTWSSEEGRQRKAFNSEAEAHQRAEEVIDDFTKGVSFRSNVTAVKAVRMAEYDKLLAEHNVSLGDAVRHYLSHLGKRQSEKKDALEAAHEYLASFEDKSTRNYQTVRCLVLQFGRAFGKTLDAITLKELDTYLRGVSKHGRTRNNHLNTLKTFFKWAQKWGYVPQGDVEINKIDRFKEGGKTIEVFTPDEIRKLLNAADDDLLPALAIGAFAGVRSAEIGRLCWEDIRMDERVILLDASKTKTKRRRMPLISDNLALWLNKCGGPKKGRIRGGSTKFHADRKALSEKTGVAWKHNGLRKSYISYRMAQPDGDSTKVAKQCGNSADMVEECYKGLVTPSSAEQWFSIAPTKE